MLCPWIFPSPAYTEMVNHNIIVSDFTSGTAVRDRELRDDTGLGVGMGAGG